MMDPLPGRSPRRIAVASALAAAAALFAAAAPAQKIDDVPPAVQNNVPPNFMFMIDNSGSMNNIVPAEPYSRTGSYQGACTGSNITVVPTTAAVELRVQNGNPRIRAGGTTLMHVSLRPNTSTTAFCFNNTATYSAKLLANGGTATDRVPDTNYLDTEYSGHFLNWYFGNFDGPVTAWTDRKRVTTGAVETRMEIAKRVAKSTVDGLPVPPTGQVAVRVGLSTYRRTGDGGELRVPMQDLVGSTRTTLRSAIDALAPGGQTPLATTLADIGRYMGTGYNGPVNTARDSGVAVDTLLRISGTDNAARNACLENSPVACNASAPAASQKPIQEWCQRSTIFAMTDGRPQHDRGFNNNSYVRDYDGDCGGINASSCVNNGATGSWDQKRTRTYESQGSDYMDDVAKLLFDVDWRPDLRPARGTKLSKNNISTYMIGFADPVVQNDPLLINTARQGGGTFIAASDGPTLASAFREVITDALAKDAAAAAVSVTAQQIKTDTVGFSSSFNSGSWYGDLESYPLDPTTGLKNGPVFWSARDRLNAQSPASRKIVSFNGVTGVPFTAAHGTAFRVRAPTLSDALIAYTRGDRTGEGSTFRARVHLLGDIVNAEPVVVNYASGPVVYQPANDGMLHAIDGRVLASATTRGQELWAYVPSLIHSKLAGRANPLMTHEFLVDATPATALVGTSRILVGGLGKGGAGYYALDITNDAPATESDAASRVLWEFKPSNMGYSFGTPVIVNTSAGWRVVVTSGLRNDGDTATGGLGGDGRSRIWVLNPLTGAVVKTFVTPSGMGSSTAALGLAHLASPVEPGSSAVVRFLYGGDLSGNVWRVDLNASDGSSPVRIARLRDALDNPQPVSAAPVIGPVPGSPTKLFVYVGTGQYFSVDDVPNTAGANRFASQTQSIYGIVDDTSDNNPSLPDIRHTGGSCPSNGGNGAFACQTGTALPGGGVAVTHNTVDLTSKRGFYLDLPVAGARVNTQMALSVGGTLVVVVNVPSNIICNPGGSSFVMFLAADTGGAVQKVVGGAEYFDTSVFLGDKLSSRPVLVRTSGTGGGGGGGPGGGGPDGGGGGGGGGDCPPESALTHGSDTSVDSNGVPCRRNPGSSGPIRRIYIRPLN